jgi:hypothetical protein
MADWPKTTRRKVTKASPPARYHTTDVLGLLLNQIFGADFPLKLINALSFRSYRALHQEPRRV